MSADANTSAGAPFSMRSRSRPGRPEFLRDCDSLLFLERRRNFRQGNAQAPGRVQADRLLRSPGQR